MSLHVGLFAISPGAERRLEGMIVADATFSVVDDLEDLQAVNEVAGNADVIVGRWPVDAGPAPDLELLQHTGAGMDYFEKMSLPPGAFVCNVYGHADSIAEHVFALLLALKRNLWSEDARLRRGRWPRPNAIGKPHDVAGSTMGIVGLGRIGEALVGPAVAFGMDVVGTRSQRPEGPPPERVEWVGGAEDLDRLLETSDVVVLTLPLTAETEGLLGSRELDLLGPDGYLINVARGLIVAERPLYEALHDERIAGAGIDTWYRYPREFSEERLPSACPFHELDNVVMTPHSAGWTTRTADHRWSVIADNIDRIARGERPKNVVWEPGDR